MAAQQGEGMATELGDFRVTARDLRFVGQGLRRPECVLCNAAGDIFVSHWEGGVTRIEPNGRQTDYLGPGKPTLRTNGFAISPEGDFLCANLEPPGGVWRVTRERQQYPVCLEADGILLDSCNFCMVDRQGRVYITVSTRKNPRQLAYRKDVASGFIVLVDRKGARIVADGIGYTNEAIVDPSGEYLYVNETFGRRTSRYRIAADGGLSGREIVAEYGPGTFPDGLAFDEEGGIWQTSVVSNRLIHIAPDGRQTIVYEESDAAAVAAVEASYQANAMRPTAMSEMKFEVAKNIASINFGGPDRRTAYMGNLLDSRVYAFRAPVAGLKPSHWEVRF